MNMEMLTPVQNGHTNPTLEFAEGQLLFKVTNLNGTKTERLVSWESLREAVLGIPVDSGWVPPAVRRSGTGRNGDWAVIFLPPGPRLLELTGDTPGAGETVSRVTVPLPGLVMFGIAVRYWVWAVAGDELDPHRDLYRAPLPNVGADGEVCWGAVRPPRCSTSTIMKAWELFARSTFNNHYANAKSRRSPDDVREVLRELAAAGDGARYPVEDLVRHSGDGASLHKVLRIFFETTEMPR